ncbi:MAG TPA: hypothetical protein VE379_04635 [Vicinamibacterales bacterium]|jgi:hypothetical protein|nr:hypothetical protein [Vicinamibacterales bacterium]
MASTSRAKAPWERKNPKRRNAKKKPTQLSSGDRAQARARARAAGRRYPNLVDNMAIARKKNAAQKKKQKKR